MKHFFKRGLPLLLVLTMLSGLGVSADYRDMPTGWSKPAMESAVENQILQGFDGYLNPTGLLTRAELATIIVRVFGAKTLSDISGFIDVGENDWFHDYIAGAVHMGVIRGTGLNTMSPQKNATREEVFVVLAKALKLENGDPDILVQFADSGETSDWAVGAASAMVEAGYIAGSDGLLLPRENITREQFAQVLYNIFTAYYREPGRYSSDAKSSVIVNSPDVVLENMKVAGDVVIGDGVGDGDVWLNSVEIGGRLIVRGGGINSIHLNASEVDKITIAKVDGAVRVVIDGGSISVAEIADGSDQVIIEGGEIGELIVSESVPVSVKDAAVGELTVNSPAAEVAISGESVVEKIAVDGESSTVGITDNAKVSEVVVNAAGAEIKISGTTAVENLSVAPEAEGASVTTSEGTTIGSISADTDVTVTGDGKVSEITGDGNVTDASGEAVKPSTGDSGSQSGSSSGSGGIVLPHTHIYNEVERVEATCKAEGLITSKCSCGDVKTEVIAKLAHTYGDPVVTKATCTKAGKSVIVCTVCGEQEVTPIPAKGHTGSWFILPSETANVDAQQKRICEVCGEVEIESTGKPQVAPAAGYELSVKNDQIRVTVTPLDSSNIFSYNLYLSADGENWVSAGSALAQLSEGVLPYCKLSSYELIPGTTYTKLKIRSLPSNGYVHNEIVLDCDITAVDGGTSGNEAIFYQTYDGKIMAYVGTVDKYETVLSLHDSAGDKKIIKYLYGDSYVILDNIDDFTDYTYKVSRLGDMSVSDAHTGTLTVKYSEVSACVFSEETEHIYGDWVVTKEPNSTEDGERQRTCLICGNVETEVIDNGLPKATAAIGFEFIKRNNSFLMFNIKTGMSDTVTTEEILRYDVYFSTDNGNSWSERLTYAMNDTPAETLSSLFSETENFRAGVTYNKVKIVSAPKNNLEYKPNSAIFDCNLVVNDGGECAGTVTFTEGDDVNYTVGLVGVNTDNPYTGITIWSDQEKSKTLYDSVSPTSSTTRTIRKTMVSDDSWYEITQLSTPEITDDGAGASVTLYRSQLNKCQLPTATEDQNVTGVKFVGTSGNFAFNITRKSDEGVKRYEIYLSKDGVNWTDNFVAYASVCSLTADQNISFFNLSELEAGEYTKVMVRTCPTSGDSIDTVFNCSLTVVDGGESTAAAEFETDGTDNTVTVSGLDTESGKFSNYILLIAGDESGSTVKSSECHPLETTQFELFINGGTYYSIQQYGSVSVSDDGLTAQITVANGAFEGIVLKKLLDVPAGYEFSLNDKGDICIKLDLGDASTEGVYNYNIMLLKDESTDYDNYANFGAVDYNKIDQLSVMNPLVLNWDTFTKLRIRSNPAKDPNYKENYAVFDCNVIGKIEGGSAKATFTKVDEGIRVDFTDLDENGTDPILHLSGGSYTLVGDRSRNTMIIENIEGFENLTYWVDQFVNTVADGEPQTVTATRLEGTSYQCVLLKPVATVTDFSFAVDDYGMPIVTVTEPEDTTGITGYKVFFGKDDSEVWYSMADIRIGETSNHISHEHLAGTYSRVKITSQVNSDSNYLSNDYIADCSLTISEPTDRLDQVLCTFYDSGKLTIDSGAEANTPYVVNLLDSSSDIFGEYYLSTDENGKASEDVTILDIQKQNAKRYIASKITVETVSGTVCSFKAEKCGVSQTLEFVHDSPAAAVTE